MVTALVSARQTLQISSDRPVIFLLQRPGRRDPRGFQRLRSRQYARGSNCAGIPRVGGTGFIRHLVVQPIAAGWIGPEPVRRRLYPRSANPVCRNWTPALGARRYERSWDSELCGGNALDGKLAGTGRVWFRRAFRYANRGPARDDGAEPISIHRSHGRPGYGEMRP